MQQHHHWRPLVRLSVPVAASQVSDMLVHTADSIMVGTLGAVQLAGVSLAGSAAMIFMMFAVGMTVAITPLAGEAVGRADLVAAARVGRAGVWTSTIVVSAIVALLLGASPWFHLLGAESDVNTHALPYLQWLLPSAIFRIWFGTFKQLAEALSNTRVAMIINIGTNVLNIALNWVFIHGNLGAPALGAEGAGLATFLARGCAAGAAWWVYRTSGFFRNLRTAMHTTEARAELRRTMAMVFRTGTGIGLQIVVEVLGFASGALMMGWIGATALAAHTIALNMASITFMIALGLGSAATILVSNLRGEGRFDQAAAAGRTALTMVLLYEVMVVVVYATLRWQLPHLYVQDPTVIDLAATLLLWAGLFSLFDGVQVVSLGVLRGYNDIRIPTILATVAYLGVAIPVGYVAAFHFSMGATGVWLGYLVGLSVASVGYLWRISVVTRRER